MSRRGPFFRLRFLAAFWAIIACGHHQTCTDPTVEAVGIAWDRLSGRVAYSRLENPLAPGASRGCVFLIEIPARRVQVLRDVEIGHDVGNAPVGSAKHLAFRMGGNSLTFVIQNTGGYWELHDLLIASGGEVILFPADRTHHLYPSWSYDGRLAYYSNGTMGAREMVDDMVVLEGAVQGRVAWTPSGSFVASLANASSAGDLYLVDPLAHSVKPLVTGVNGEIYDQPALSPDGSRLAYVRRGSGPQGTYEEELWIANADGQNQSQLTTAKDDQQPAWSSDGRSVLFNRYGEGLFLYGLDAGVTVQVTKRPADYMTWLP